MKWVWAVVAFVAIAYLLVCASLYLSQRSLLYYPTPERQAVTADSIELAVDGETLKVWRIGNGDEAVLYFGGNAEDVSLNIEQLRWTLPHHTLYLVNYRGYGGSTGTPSEPTLLGDALLVADYVLERHASLSVIGRSLGSGVAMHIAAERPVSSLILVTPFDSIASVAAGIWPWLPIDWLVTERYDSYARAADVSAQVLVVAAGRDEVIPRRHTDRLMTALPLGTQRLNIDQANHNDLSHYPDYWIAIGTFIDQGQLHEPDSTVP
ncbi:MAG: alpha/beta hydrolase [Lysobacteraceae bacterium]|nr:MAG: alpha/beta hydrolase [Xanthomonadaceae bacterium]